ncbi:MULTISPECIES: MarR family winged helix-turn-helix transcriptional regulator [Chromobacterium]|uniref:MarR family transcriptional regulator n=1 Tax=Chromobacterium rhizoryzae TaxID=1778675 RepID=A0AAD0WAR2_9NEIS|nr:MULTISPECIES: MarR family transcriptional regulator [Chromobacterium]AXT48837.1 MarR family transcriptional regulator [Chromobacterium rhizoryzae]MDH0341507.1 MarR family transcriptional regulator [Chromobacterium haemolyticum]QOD82820.1 MarR family transcriptional regulator [Chromobacterium haemolyticum]BBH15484.1 MarR family transcriptional regulator [Chromobacterium haemolyticum]
MTERAPNLLQQIGRTGRAMYAAFEQQVGYPLPRWRILAALTDLEQATQKQLATRLMMDPGALTRQLKAMEEEELVRRITDPADNRQTLVTLAPAGQALIEAVQPKREAFFRHALADVPVSQMETTLEVLHRLEQRFRGQD